MTHTLLTRLFLDAQDAVLAAIDHIPGPGRGGPLGSLNAPGNVVANLALLEDIWIQRFCAGAPTDEWLGDWASRGNATPGIPIATSLDEAREAYVRIAARSSAWVRDASQSTLLGPADLSGTSRAGVPTVRAYMVARAIAHAFVHAGELSVIGAMVRADDLGLPGPLPRSSEPTAASDWTVPLVAALLQDGYVELGRAAAVAPRPAIVGSVDRFNSLAYTLVHVMRREDVLWNQQLGKQPPHWWLDEVDGVQPRESEIDWDSTMEMAAEVSHSISKSLLALDETSGAQPIEWGRRETDVGAQLARSVGHVFSHASEMLAISSQFGTEDLGMPGALEYVREATTSWRA